MRIEKTAAGRTDGLAVYVHIPFCVSKCAYCDFLSFPAGSPDGSDKRIEEYFATLITEIKAAPQKGRRVSSIYFGGGTPSRPDPSYIARIMDSLGNVFSIDENAEVSIEANPGTLGKDAPGRYLKAGINRMSLGVQSFDDGELAALGRIHTAAEAEESYYLARNAGFSNLNLDLIAAIPGQNRESLLRTVEKAVSLNPEHISLYSLIIEPGTPFYERYADQVPDPHYDHTAKNTGKRQLPDEDEEREMMHAACEELGKAGYDRYEISNFARQSPGAPGKYRCRHNVNYWERGEYLGFGIGAASLVNETRYSNVRDIAEYMERVKDSGFSVDEATVQDLTESDAEAEYMFLGLRMTEGVIERKFAERFGHSIGEVYGDVPDRFIADGLLERKDGRFFLTSRGLDLANTVMAGFV
ncbi:MAG: radical SAM family heme chaperone HemW [Lachnospiraceae bacterium]|nr:radical SAM family heme chaperone HemW [Lachnospiraceae bacterium]